MAARKGGGAKGRRREKRRERVAADTAARRPRLDVLQAPVLALVLAEPLIFSSLTYNPFALKELLVSTALLAVGGLFLWRALRGRPASLAVTPVAVAAFVVFAAGCLSVALSLNRDWSLPSLAFLARSLLVFVLAAAAFAGGRRVAALLPVVVLAVTLASLYGLMQYVEADPVAWRDTFSVAEVSAGRRIFSTFGHPNFFGAWLAALLPLVAVPLIDRKDRALAAAAAAAAALAVPALFLTLSRSAWAGALAGMGFLAAAVLLRRGGVPGRTSGGGGAPRRRAALTAGLALTLLAVVWFLLPSTVRRRANPVNIASSRTLKSRFTIWRGAAAMIAERPLAGFGAGTFQYYFPEHREKDFFDYHHDRILMKHAHNEVLETWAEEGALGLGALLLLGGALATCGLGASLRAEGRDGLLAAGLFAAVLSLAVGNLFDVNGRFVNSALFFWLFAGVLSALCPGLLPRTRRRLVLGRAAAVLFLAASAAVCAFDARQVVAERLLRKAEEGLASGDGAAAATALRAAALQPTDTRGLMLAAQSCFDAGDFPGALEIYRKAGKVFPYEPLLHYDMALSLYRMGRLEEGIEAIRRSLLLHPKHGPSHDLRFDLFTRRGREVLEGEDPERALEYFSRLTAWYPRNARGHVNLGNALAVLRRYSEAAESYQRALDIDPENAQALENLGKIGGIPVKP